MERLDAEDFRALVRRISGVVPDDRRGQRPDPELNRDQVRLFAASLLQLVVDLAHDGGIAVHDPVRHIFVAGPRSIGNNKTTFACVLGRARDRVVVGAGYDLDLRSFACDSIDPRLGRAGGDVDFCLKAKQGRDMRDGASVVAIGGSGEGEGTDRREALREFRHGLPGFERAAEAGFDRSVDRPGRAEDLERRKAEAARFVFDQELPDPEAARERRRVEQRRRRIAGQAPMKLERPARVGAGSVRRPKWPDAD